MSDSQPSAQTHQTESASTPDSQLSGSASAMEAKQSRRGRSYKYDSYTSDSPTHIGEWRSKAKPAASNAASERPRQPSFAHHKRYTNKADTIGHLRTHENFKYVMCLAERRLDDRCENRCATRSKRAGPMASPSHSTSATQTTQTRSGISRNCKKYKSGISLKNRRLEKRFAENNRYRELLPREQNIASAQKVKRLTAGGAN